MTNPSPSHGKVLILGLDGATWTVLEPLIARGVMPHLAALRSSGCWGELTSTVPHLTAPAWTTFMTGKNPGKHGVFHFVEPDEEPQATSGTRTLVDARSIKSATLWDILSHHGRRVGIVNLPMIYPPHSVNGFMITGLLTPPGAKVFTYPPDLGRQLPGYRIEVERFADRLPFSKVGGHEPVPADVALMDDFIQLMEEHAATADRLMLERAWDVFMIVFAEPDRMGHYLWNYLRAEDLDGTPKAHAIHDAVTRYFRQLDTAIGALVRRAGAPTTVFVISDHGMGPLPSRRVHWNAWLASHGWLVPKDRAGSGGSPDAWLHRLRIPRDVVGRMIHKIPGLRSSRIVRQVRRPTFGIARVRLLADLFLAGLDMARWRSQVDVLLAFQTIANGLVAVLAGSALGLPSAVFIRGNREYREYGPLPPVVYRRASTVLVQSRLMRDDLLAHLAATGRERLAAEVALKTAVVPNGVTLPPAAPPVGEGIVFVGRLVADKGVADLIRAAALLDGARLTIIGDGPERAELQALARRLYVRADFTGWIGPGEVQRRLRLARVLALPSYRGDGLPNAVLEAMSLGRPIVASDIAGIPEIVQHGRTEFLVKPGDVGGWSDLSGGRPAADADADGMPDDWELRFGFDLDLAEDGSQDADADGYTNVEEYLNDTPPIRLVGDAQSAKTPTPEAPVALILTGAAIAVALFIGAALLAAWLWQRRRRSPGN